MYWLTVDTQQKDEAYETAKKIVDECPSMRYAKAFEAGKTVLAIQSWQWTDLAMVCVPTVQYMYNTNRIDKYAVSIEKRYVYC